MFPPDEVVSSTPRVASWSSAPTTLNSSAFGKPVPKEDVCGVFWVLNVFSFDWRLSHCGDTIAPDDNIIAGDDEVNNDDMYDVDGTYDGYDNVAGGDSSVPPVVFGIFLFCEVLFFGVMGTTSG